MQNQTTSERKRKTPTTKTAFDKVKKKKTHLKSVNENDEVSRNEESGKKVNAVKVYFPINGTN